MSLDPISAVLDIGGKLIDKLIPDPQAKAEAQLKLLQMQQSGELEAMKTQMSAIVTEAQSADPWTSRARPAFMYVIYIILLASLPMGFLAWYSPEGSTAVISGFKGWLAAIPPEIITLFGAGYLGYGGMRTFDKWKSVSK